MAGFVNRRTGHPMLNFTGEGVAKALAGAVDCGWVPPDRVPLDTEGGLLKCVLSESDAKRLAVALNRMFDRVDVLNARAVPLPDLRFAWEPGKSWEEWCFAGPFPIYQAFASDGAARNYLKEVAALCLEGGEVEVTARPAPGGGRVRWRPPEPEPASEGDAPYAPLFPPIDDDELENGS